MPRLTPARILYLLIGLVLGLALAIAGQSFLGPSLTAGLPFFAPAPTPVVPTGPTQFTAAALERVQMLNAPQDHNGVQIRLDALQLYKDGMAVTYTLTSGRGAAPATLEPETFSATDDRNTTYSMSPLGTSAAVSPGFTTGVVAFTPAPPAEARTLRIAVPNALAIGLRLREGQTRVTSGPWDFQITLTR